jgi:hypothetical protein
MTGTMVAARKTSFGTFNVDASQMPISQPLPK